MGRTLRSTAGNIIFHVINRANGRMDLFRKDEDYEAFERLLTEAKEKHPMRILAYCIMPNHWHLLLCPYDDGGLSNFMQWLTLTHTRRWHAHYHTTGYGHAYQGRFKSFPVESDAYFIQLCRYVERNPLRAGLITRAEEWRWSSLWRRLYGSYEARTLLTEWPIPPDGKYVQLLNAPELETTLATIRNCVNRGSPYGSDEWTNQIIAELGLQATVTPRGRPKKGT